MSTHELPQQLAKSTPSRLGKIAAFGLAVTAAVPMAQAVVVLDVQGLLSIASGGTLDVTGNTDPVLTAAQNGVVVRAADGATQLANINNIRGWINTGFAGFTWTGTGITSGTAAIDATTNGVLGVMMYDNDQIGLPSFLGVDLTTNPHQVMVRMTYAGDFDATGAITLDDYGLLDFYLASSLNAQGDIDGDGLVGFSDYGVLDFGLASGDPYGPLGNAVPSAGAAVGAVPEPASGALLLSGLALTLAGRRRTRK